MTGGQGEGDMCHTARNKARKQWIVDCGLMGEDRVLRLVVMQTIQDWESIESCIWEGIGSCGWEGVGSWGWRGVGSFSWEGVGSVEAGEA